ncbi:hypothetical protein KR018_008345 [Drosophila ironensis]|nr:hypothetical protein KR018_008345 [Drosophila ironensis]
MADFLKTEDPPKMNKIDGIRKLVKQNSKRCANGGEKGFYDLPCCSDTDIFASCPELARVTVGPEDREVAAGAPGGCPAEQGADKCAGMPHIYRSGQLVAIGRRVATQMLNPSGQWQIMRNRVHLDERLRSAGIYHNRLVSSRSATSTQDQVESVEQMQMQPMKQLQDQLQEQEQGGRGDTDPGKSN